MQPSLHFKNIKLKTKNILGQLTIFTPQNSSIYLMVNRFNIILYSRFLRKACSHADGYILCRDHPIHSVQIPGFPFQGHPGHTYRSESQSMVPRPAVLASPENLLKMQILQPYLILPQRLGIGPRYLCFQNSPDNSDTC